MSIRLRHKMQATGWGIGLLGMLMLVITGHAAAQEGMKECELDTTIVIAAAEATQDKPNEGAVEERAVPRMQPGRPALPVFKGATIEGNKLTANPGYEVGVRQDGVIMLMPVGGGGLGATGRCVCSSTGTGSCYAYRDSNKKITCLSKGQCTSCSITIDNPAMGGMKAIQ
ncbi:MAG: hypothetical protein KF814_05245 [Nitrospiraceae bacterium]|nr:hypothetical protein [Nitrospiraceae bacterium]